MTDKQFLLAVLADGTPRTQAEILRASFAERGHGFTIHSRAADLRKDGYRIDCAHVPGAERGAAWTYRLVAGPLTAPSADKPESQRVLIADGAVSGSPRGTEPSTVTEPPVALTAASVPEPLNSQLALEVAVPRAHPLAAFDEGMAA